MIDQQKPPGASALGKRRVRYPDEPPVNALFSTLRDLWMRAGGGHRTSVDLADHLTEKLGRNVNPQHVSQWCTGSDQRKPPWDVLFFVADELGYDFRIRGDGSGASIVKRPA